MGGAGAWAYVNYLAPMMSGQRPGATKAAAQEQDAGPKSSELGSRIDLLSDKLSQLQDRVDQVSKSAAQPDLEPIDKRHLGTRRPPSKGSRPWTER